MKQITDHLAIAVASLGVCILLAGCYEGREPIVLKIDQINLVEDDVYDDYFNISQATFRIDSISISEDILTMTVRYAGECRAHEFTLIGSRAWAGNQPPRMYALFLHETYGDTCLAGVQQSLMIDLSPIREWQADTGSVTLWVRNAPRGVLYRY